MLFALFLLRLVLTVRDKKHISEIRDILDLFGPCDQKGNLGRSSVVTRDGSRTVLKSWICSGEDASISAVEAGEGCCGLKYTSQSCCANGASLEGTSASLLTRFSVFTCSAFRALLLHLPCRTSLHCVRKQTSKIRPVWQSLVLGRSRHCFHPLREQTSQLIYSSSIGVVPLSAVNLQSCKGALVPPRCHSVFLFCPEVLWWEGSQQVQGTGNQTLLQIPRQGSRTEDGFHRRKGEEVLLVLLKGYSFPSLPLLCGAFVTHLLSVTLTLMYVMGLETPGLMQSSCWAGGRQRNFLWHQSVPCQPFCGGEKLMHLKHPLIGLDLPSVLDHQKIILFFFPEHWQLHRTQPSSNSPGTCKCMEYSGFKWRYLLAFLSSLWIKLVKNHDRSGWHRRWTSDAFTIIMCV